MRRLARRLRQQDACNDPETSLPRKNIRERTDKRARSRSRFRAKRFLRKWARERGMVDVCNVTRSRRSDIFSSRPEERRLPRRQSRIIRAGKYARCSSTRGYDSSFLLRFGNTFPDSNDRESLASENVIHLALRSRIPRSWNSRTH